MPALQRRTTEVQSLSRTWNLQKMQIAFFIQFTFFLFIPYRFLASLRNDNTNDKGGKVLRRLRRRKTLPFPTKRPRHFERNAVK